MKLTDNQKNETMTKLEKELDLHESLCKAWQGVTRNYKKNGEPFANLQQNFNGLTVSGASYSLHANEKELSVTTKTNRSGYQSESIHNTELAKHTRFEVDESRIIKESYLEPYFFLTVDELQTLIDEKINYHLKRVSDLKKAIEENEKDNKIIENILEYMGKEFEKINPDTAQIFKASIIRNYY